jgi:hypothetical protein
VKWLLNQAEGTAQDMYGQAKEVTFGALEGARQAGDTGHRGSTFNCDLGRPRRWMADRPHRSALLNATGGSDGSAKPSSVMQIRPHVGTAVEQFACGSPK